MVTKARIKVIKSLARKKNRFTLNQFVVEGYKSIIELLEAGFYTEEIYVEEERDQLSHINSTIVTSRDMKAMSGLATPPGYLAVFEMKVFEDLPITGSVIALENIQDPGNLGTIIRLADWFGIKHIICSEQTVDVYNSKCIQASMGSIARVSVHYTDLDRYLETSSSTVYPTAMNGKSMYETSFEDNGILLMGSESHGLSESLIKMGTAVSIPHFQNTGTTESLNVAMATALFLGEWKRPK
jgi:TrmH family RNA methyltransferase